MHYGNTHPPLSTALAVSRSQQESIMKTNVTIKTTTIPASDTFQSCYCGDAKHGQTCEKCGFVPRDEVMSYEVGTVWERVTTSKHGSATFSYDAGDESQRQSRLVGALRRAVGYSVDIGYGHYGKSCGTSGLSVHGSYETERI